MENKNLLLVTSEFPPLPGGIGNHTHQLAKHLSLNGFTVTVLADQRDSDREKEFEFDSEQTYQVVRIGLRSPRFPMYFSRLRRLFYLSQDVEWVVASGKFSLWAVAILSFFRKKKYLAVIHGSEVNFTSAILKKLISVSLKRFHHLIAVSHFTKSLMDSDELAPITVIPNGSDSSKWKNIKPTHISGNPKLITVGHVSERKGQKRVISILPHFLKRFPDLHYHCIGIPTDAEELKVYADELGVIDHVSFHGMLSDEKMGGMLLDTDVFIMLSGETKTGDVEGFGIAILEANGFGIPAIGALGSGVEDAIKDGVSGRLVDSSDSEAVLQAFQEILDQYNTYSREAKAWAQTHAWEQIVQRYVQVIEEVDR